MKREKLYNNHHLCPYSRWWATNETNIERLRMTVHDAIHTVFENKIFPEQLEKLAKLTEKALLPDVYDELMDWIHSRDIHDPTQRYKEWALLIPKRFKHKQQDNGENQIY